jgi:SAM-dependent methyltransferase
VPGGHDAVRRSYDAVASDYAKQFGDELADKPLDRALLGALVEQSTEGAPIADLGCGPGHVAAWLSEHGADAVGIDLSPAMVDAARVAHPGIEFREGDLLSLPADDGAFGAAVAFYSIIHLDPDEVPAAMREIGRVLRPGGRFLVSFHIGTDTIHRDEWWDREVDLDFHLLAPDAVTSQLETAGFTVEALLEREHYPHEFETRRAYLLARR